MNMTRALFVSMAASSVLFAGDLDSKIQDLFRSRDIPGLSVAHVKGGKIVWQGAFGYQNASTRTLITKDTIFEAASLTKPVFAYAVLKLVASGRLDLDKPLSTYLPGYFKEDERAAKITARHVLSHTTGLPNWARGKFTLKTYFEPGSRFSYSGEGFVYLQRVVEKITGVSTDAWMNEQVFTKLGMTSSSMVKPVDPQRLATPHDSEGKPGNAFDRPDANAAASLYTTAGDYARFLLAVMKDDTAARMFGIESRVRRRGAQNLDAEATEQDFQVAWGLGIGLQVPPAGKTFFHWGDNGSFKAFVVGSRDRGDAVVYFANGSNGLAIAGDLVKLFLDDPMPATAWLRY